MYILERRRRSENTLGEAQPKPLTLSMRPKPYLILDHFGFGLSLVPVAHKPTIDALVDRIVAPARQGPGPLGSVRLVGHTDYIDTDKYNEALGLMRAKAVRGALATALENKMRGITSRIEIVPESRGELEPVTTDRSEAGRELNRRVEVFVSLNPPAPLPTKPKGPGVPDPRTIKNIPDDPGSPRTRPSDLETNILRKVPKLQRNCVNPYEVVVKLLRRALDEALKRSPIPPQFHNRIRELAEKRAAGMRDDLIDRGLEEMGLEGRFKQTARNLIVQAVEQACF